MNTTRAFSMLPLFLAFLISFVSKACSTSANQTTAQDFVQCLSQQQLEASTIYTPSSPLFYPILHYKIQNIRFALPSVPKPLAIVSPQRETQVPAIVSCAKNHGLEIRVRSGGHDFEGLSYVSEHPFVVVDLFNVRSITIDAENATAWVQAGASLGELFFQIDKESNGTLAFPAGDWNSVGVGGQLSGGGYGTLLRKYGLGSDNVIDARFVGVSGTILDRNSMGEDLFWAIRGGGGGNFGIVLAWKLKLVPVPKTVTVFTVSRTLEQNATNLVGQWQEIAHTLPEELFIRLQFTPVESISTRDGKKNKKTIMASFMCTYLGGIDALLPEMEQRFPDLGVERKDCRELSLLGSILYYLGSPPNNTEILISGENQQSSLKLKQKSDFVKTSIPEKGLIGLWELLLQRDPGEATMVWSPFGGIMNKISSSEIPFPYRAGYRFVVYQAVQWCDAGTLSDSEALAWMERLYNHMGRFVSQNPRAQYVNYRDLDLGTTNKNTTPEEARTWGVKYFDSNFERLVRVKTTVDPENFFRNQQSIPAIPPSSTSSLGAFSSRGLEHAQKFHQTESLEGRRFHGFSLQTQ